MTPQIFRAECTAASDPRPGFVLRVSGPLEDMTELERVFCAELAKETRAYKWVLEPRAVKYRGLVGETPEEVGKWKIMVQLRCRAVWTDGVGDSLTSAAVESNVPPPLLSNEVVKSS